jgi:hypothetical protein
VSYDDHPSQSRCEGIGRNLTAANNGPASNEDESRIALKTVLQVEFSPSLLSDREAVLKRQGYAVISVLGSSNARILGVSPSVIGVIVVGHGAPWSEREGLVAHFQETLPAIPIVALLRSTDAPFHGADFNCPADNPPLWERTVIQILQRAENLR